MTPLTRCRQRITATPSRMPHKCHGNSGNCPSRSHPIWEMPINELDRRDDPDFDESLTGCHLVSSCSNIYHKDQFRFDVQNKDYPLLGSFFLHGIKKEANGS